SYDHVATRDFHSFPTRRSSDLAYTSEVHVLVTESLIRALELRMDRVPPARARDSIDMYHRTGLLLTPYFYDELANFETSDLTIRESFVNMARQIQLKTEQQRFEERFYKIPVPQKAVARPEIPQPPLEPPANPIRD